MNEVTLPKELQDELNNLSEVIVRPKEAPKIFIGLPNMTKLNVGLVNKLFAMGMQREFVPWFHFLTEKRQTDYARNVLAVEFLKSDCEWFAMIDADVDPHANFLSLCAKGKDIISANVHCWINGELMSSLWQRADCEECRCVKIYEETGNVHDASQYCKDKNGLYRWNPFRNEYHELIGTDGSRAKCRCRGTGKDPWVFQTYQKQFEKDQLIQVDSAGAAALMIHRRIMEKLKMPYFAFLYKESREILLTEDHYFCWKAGIEGFEIWGDPQMLCSHFKLIDLVGVNQAIIRAFHAGMEVQKRSEEELMKSVEVPISGEEVT